MIGYLRTLLLFYRRHLRVQPLREIMAVAGIAAGVALLFAVQVAHRSITGSFEEVAHGVAGHASIEIASRAPEGFSQGVAAEVERMGTVKIAAAMLEQPIIAVGPTGQRALTLLGATEQIGELGGKLARQFQHTAAASHRGLLVLTEATARAIGASPGGEITILAGARTDRLSVAETVSSHTLGSAATSPIAATSLPIVQSIAGKTHRVSRILLEPQPGREHELQRELEARFGSTLNIRPIDTEAKLLANAAGPERQVTLLFSAISLVAGVILAYNALLLASDERRRFIAYLIATGTPDSLIVASLAFDALILGVLGSVIGLLAGDAVSLIAYRSPPGYIAAAFGVGGQRVVGTETILIAFAGGMAAAAAAAALPALMILRSSAVAEPEAVGQALSFARKLRVSDALTFASGVLLLCASVVISALAPGTTVVAVVGMAAALVICLPMTARYLLQIARSVSRHSGDPALRLAVAELRSSPTRPVALLATGTIAAFLMIVIGGSVADVQHAVRRGATDVLSSGVLWIKPGGTENVYATQPFAYAETQRRLQAVTGVRSILPLRDSFLDLPQRRVWIVGVPPQLPAQIAPSQLVEGSLATADRHLREGGWVAISEPIAHEYHLHIGGQFTLPTPTGDSTMRVAAIVANYGWLPGAVIMNGEDHARLWDSSAVSQLAVTLTPGVALAAAKRALESALADDPALTVNTDGERRAEVSAVLGSTLARLSDTTIIVLIATVASVIALMLAAVSQGRGRLNSLMSIGMSFWQLARLIYYEAGLMLLAGCLLGMASGIVGQYLIDGWLHQSTGSPVEFDPAWLLGLRTVGIAVGISLVASLFAVVGTVRFQPNASFATE